MTSALLRTRGLIFPILGVVFAIFLGKVTGDGQSSLLLFGFVLAGVFMLAFFSVGLSLHLLIASMLLSPEIIVGKTSLREITIRFDDIVLTAMILSWLLRMAVLKDMGFIRKNPMNVPIYVFCTLATVSTSLGVFNEHVRPLAGFFFTLKFIEYFLLYMMVVNFVRDFDGIERLITTIIVVWGLICLYAFFQALTGGDVSAPFEGSMSERNTLSGYIVLVGSVAAAIMMYTHRKMEGHLLVICVLMAVVVLVFSVSRSGWIAALVACFILFGYSPRKELFFIAIISCIAILLLFTPEVARDRINFTFNQVTNPLNQVRIGQIALDTSTSSRIFSLWEVLKDFFAHPFIGFGITGYRLFLDGQFFRTLVEMGVPGLLCLLWIFRRLGRISKQAIRAGLPVRIRAMCIGFYAGFCGLMVHALTANTFIIVRIAEPFWCLAGLMTVALGIAEREIMPGEGNTPLATTGIPMA